MRSFAINPAGVPKPKAVPAIGAAPNANGDKSMQARPPRLKNTRDYGKKPVVAGPFEADDMSTTRSGGF